MANFDETGASSYNWATDGVYVIEQADPLEGGLEGVSNRQGRELAIRTRNLHERLADLKTETADRDAALEEDLDAKTEAAISSSKEYTDARETSILAAVDSKDVATMQSSKEYIDTTAVAVRSEMAAADTAALRDAKSYADTIVAALVSSSPEALNTLQELAAALGNDPNFATTVMNEIGKRATTKQVDDAVAGKADANHGHTAAQIGAVSEVGGAARVGDMGIEHSFYSNKRWLYFTWPGIDTTYLGIPGTEPTKWALRLQANGRLSWINEQVGSTREYDIYHTGNIGTAPTATKTTNGLMSAADKTKLDAMSPVKIYARGKVSADGGNNGQKGLINIVTGREPGYTEGVYRLTHSLGLIGHCTFISLIGRKNQSLTYRVDTEMGSHTVIRVHDIVNYNNYTDCEFSYVIMA